MTRKIMKNRLVQFLLQRNKEASKAFCAAKLSRIKYRAKYPTEIAALKCMDGRINLSVATESPIGIIQPYRNIGGQFDLGSEFGPLLAQWIDYSLSRGRDCLTLVSYHRSKKDKHLGCRGFGYNVKAAQDYTRQLVGEIEETFGNHDVVYPIQVGFETEEDAITIHGHNGKILDMAEFKKLLSEAELIKKVHELFEDMGEQMVKDLAHYLAGNQRHIAKIRKYGRHASEANHKEQALMLGRGFDWLHIPNKALIIGPYSRDLSSIIKIAAGILLENLQKKRIPKEDGIVLMASGTYREASGPEPVLAEKKARSLASLALKTIKETPELEELRKYIHVLVGTVNMETRLFTPVEFQDK